MKNYCNITLMSIIAIMYATVCMETDIYVPAFPDMKIFFDTTAEAIQQILSFNFIGICLGSLLFGPLSDSFGRKRILLLGLTLFSISSWCCWMVTQFDLFLLCRFLQGLGAAAPMVVSFALLLESYEPKMVAQLCGALNIFITGVMAAAPILGSYLNIHFGWQANFLVIALLATLSLIGSMLFVAETLPVKERNKFSIISIVKNYGTVLTSFTYMAGSFACYLMFAGMMLFIANLSIIFMEYLGVPKETYAYYQASPSITFAIFSLLSIWIIQKFGIYKTKIAGVIITLIGTILLIATSAFQPNPVLICAAMVVYSIGITLAAPIYGMEAANVFPQMRGIATGMSNALRFVIIAGLVGIGGMLFDGSILPVAILIGVSTAFIVGFAVLLLKRQVGGAVVAQ